MDFDYRKQIAKEFERRCSVNSAYSLRAFARDTGLAPPHLSAILSGRRGLSKERARKMAARLGLSDQEAQQFVSDVSAKHGRSHAEKRLAKVKLDQLLVARPAAFGVVKDAQFRIIADWHHLAILELSETDRFDWKPHAIAERLGISSREAASAIEALVTAGMLKKKGAHYAKTNEFIRTEDIPSRAVRLHYLQLLAKSMKALEEQPLPERDFSSVTVAIDPQVLPELKAWLRDFREKFCVEANRGGKKSEVYNLSLQFFKLTKSIKGKAI